MSSSDSLLLRLNQATRRLHADADEPWLDLLRYDVGKSDYMGLLVRMYGFEAPLESACAYTPQLSRVIEARQLTRAGLIAQDLLALGITPGNLAAIPQCFSITPFKDVAEAMGWLYVVERSTLYHEQVRRHLVQRMPELERASSYLGMFGGTSEHWQRFGKTLDRIASRTAIATRVIEAAHAGFECLQRWFRSSTPKLRSTG